MCKEYKQNKRNLKRKGDWASGLLWWTTLRFGDTVLGLA